ADFPAFAMMNAPAEAVTQFRVVELGQNAPPERRIVDVVKNMDCLGDPADFGKRASQTGGFIPNSSGTGSRSAPLPGPSTSTLRRSTASSRDSRPTSAKSGTQPPMSSS